MLKCEKVYKCFVQDNNFVPQESFMIQNSQKSICARVSFLIKLQAFRMYYYQERDSGAGIACEFSKIFKKTYSIQYLRATSFASAKIGMFFQRKKKQVFYQQSFINLYHIALLFLYLLKILENLFLCFQEV